MASTVGSHPGDVRFVTRPSLRSSAARDFMLKRRATDQQQLKQACAISGVTLPVRTVGDMLQRYGKEVSSKKRGARWEQLRIERMCREDRCFVSVDVQTLSAPHVATWRDERLQTVSPATVHREMTLLSNVFAIARDEWQWIAESPMKGVRRPKPARPRERLISIDEIDVLVRVMGYGPERTLVTVTQRICAAFLFAIETAMRRSEICGLEWSHVDLRSRVAALHMTKNGDSRKVPLSCRAVKIIEQMARGTARGRSIFDLRPDQVDALFRRARHRAGILDLHFHDTRHEAITRLSRRLRILALARMVGIRDPRILMVYYNESPSEIAKQLDDVPSQNRTEGE